MISSVFERMCSWLLLGSFSGAVWCCSSVETPETPPEPETATAEEMVSPEFILQPGDTVSIKFFYNPELNETVLIRPDGKISLQLIPELEATGLRPAELRSLISEQYSGILRRPEVAVMVQDFGGRKVYVGGEVGRPGVFPLVGRTTVLQAIFEAGGFRDTAEPRSIVVVSKKGNGPVARIVNVHDALKGEGDLQDPVIAPLDIVYVPRTTIAKINLFVDQYIKNVLPFSMSADFSYVYGAGDFR